MKQMNTIRRASVLLGVLALAWTVGSGSLFAVQNTAVARTVLADAQIEEFLLNARISDMKGVNKGVTNTRLATLSDGEITHDAQIQTVDVSMSIFQPATGPSELNFKDSYRFNIAAYRLARVLGLTNVPVSVERRVEGKPAAVTWWLEDVLMDEGARRKKQPAGWPSTRVAAQIHIVRVFDELIYNTDRNAGNLLWTTDGDMWMIDHTRTFRLDKKLRTPRLLERAERGLLDKMRGLTAETLTQAMGSSVNRFEIESLPAGRNEIVKLFADMVAKRGERAILYSMPSP